MTDITFHGRLGELIGAANWNLNVQSLGEALRLVEMNTRKLNKSLMQLDKENVKFAIIINGRNFYTDKELNAEKPETIKNSELGLIYKNLKSIDIVPVLEGSDSKILGIFTIIAAVVLFIVAVVFQQYYLIPVALALLAAGTVSLLSKPPSFEDFREIEQGGKTSYLFAGPQNVVGEGGPVPLGYGRAIVGSQVISAAYIIRDFNTKNTSDYLRDEFGNLEFIIPIKKQKK